MLFCAVIPSLSRNLQQTETFESGTSGIRSFLNVTALTWSLQQMCWSVLQLRLLILTLSRQATPCGWWRLMTSRRRCRRWYAEGASRGQLGRWGFRLERCPSSDWDNNWRKLDNIIIKIQCEKLWKQISLTDATSLGPSNSQQLSNICKKINICVEVKIISQLQFLSYFFKYLIVGFFGCEMSGPTIRLLL